MIYFFNNVTPNYRYILRYVRTYDNQQFTMKLNIAFYQQFFNSSK